MTHMRFYPAAALLIMVVALLAPSDSSAQLGVSFYTECSLQAGFSRPT